MTEASIDIRRAVPEDADAISTIGTQSFKAAYGDTADAEDLILHLDDYFGLDAVKSELDQPGRWYLVALIDDEPAAFTKIRDADKPDCVPGARVLELQQVYVLPDKQRHGLGGQLIDASFNLAGFMGVEGLWLSVWQHAPWAVNAYRKYGFEQVGTADFKLGNTVYSDWVMYRAL